MSEVEVIRLERSVNEIKGNMEKFKSEELDKLNKARADLSALVEANKADKDRLKRTTVTSPVYGIIKQIKTTTIGGVIQPGSDIIEIVPLDDTLLIEARIRHLILALFILNKKPWLKFLLMIFLFMVVWKER